MEAVGLAASIAGLVALAGQLYTVLDTFVSNVQDAPSLSRTVRSEVQAFHNSLSALNDVIFDPAFACTRRGTLISADYVVISFLDANLLFTEVESVIRPLLRTTDSTFPTKARWARKKTKISELISRLQWQKQTLVLQLNILKCASDMDAERSRRDLDKAIFQKLDHNPDLERRLGLVEEQLRLQPTLADDDAISRHSSFNDPDKVTIVPSNRRMSRANSEVSWFSNESQARFSRYGFEQVLYKSWVYQRSQHLEEDLSFRSSVLRSSAWSVLSELTLANLSIVSVLALPIRATELSEARWEHSVQAQMASAVHPSPARHSTAFVYSSTAFMYPRPAPPLPNWQPAKLSDYIDQDWGDHAGYDSYVESEFPNVSPETAAAAQSLRRSRRRFSLLLRSGSSGDVEVRTPMMSTNHERGQFNQTYRDSESKATNVDRCAEESHPGSQTQFRDGFTPNTNHCEIGCDGCPLCWDGEIGHNMDRMYSKDVVALMDHLAVKDAQRDARDKEVLGTLARTAAEMRKAFAEMKRLADEEDMLDRQAETTQEILRDPTVPASENSQVPDGVVHTKRKGVLGRALQAITGARSSADVEKMEDMLMETLTNIENLRLQTSGQRLPEPLSMSDPVYKSAAEVSMWAESSASRDVESFDLVRPTTRPSERDSNGSPGVDMPQKSTTEASCIERALDQQNSPTDSENDEIEDAASSVSRDDDSRNEIDQDGTITSFNDENSALEGSETPQVEIFKSFRVSVDDPCRIVLPLALKRYKITDDWRRYALYIVYGDNERLLGLEEKPLLLFKELNAEGRKPMFMLRRHAAPPEGWLGTS